MRCCRAHGLNTLLKVRPCRRSTHCLHTTTEAALKAYWAELAAHQHFAILGGGITGLAIAYYLTRELPKARITVYEASDRLGGWVSSNRVPVKDGSVLFEAGPRTLRPSSNGFLSARLLQELDLAKDAIFPQLDSPAARNRFLYYPDHLVRMPHPSFGLVANFMNILREPVFQGSIRSMITEIFSDTRGPNIQDESVGDFLSRRLDKTVVNRIVSAILHGIYAGDVWQLSAKSLFPSQWRDEVQAGSLVGGFAKARADGPEVTKFEAEYLQEMKGFQWDPRLRETLKSTVAFTLRDGLSMITDRLVRYLRGNENVEFKMSTPVQSIALPENTGKMLYGSILVDGTLYDKVISALPSSALNKVHNDHESRLVPTIPSVTVMTVNLYYRTPGLNPEGFGYLIPQATSFENNPERALGVVFDTAYSPSSGLQNAAGWATSHNEQLKQSAEQEANKTIVSANGFMWYNMPEKLNVQDEVKERGTKLTVMLGGHYWDGWPAYPDEKEGLALARSLLERHLGIKEEPEAWQVNLQEDCIPQFTVGHEQRLKTAHNNIWRAYRGKLRVAGSWTSGVGYNDCLRSAWEVVRSIQQGKEGTGLEHVGTNEYVRLKPIRQNETQEK